MKRAIVSCIALFSSLASAAGDEAVVVTLRGSLSARGRPVTDAQFFLAPTSGHTAIALEPSGKFEVKAVAARTYSVQISAEGFAPVSQLVSVNAKGFADLGAVILEPLKSARVSFLVGPRSSLSQATAQELELRHGACANVRAQDDSGCRLEVCVAQSGSALALTGTSNLGQVRKLGQRTLAEAAHQLPMGGTFVSAGSQAVRLGEDETFLAETSDPYCAALLHVDQISDAPPADEFRAR